ncbi:ABC transporter transmembrane domain-containing protein [Ilyobacter sp.]|uniref:ABC transporter permease n=1 Tax=Ilyobacter sp. TaxID=3100343 RepID=UPI0035669F7A
MSKNNPLKNRSLNTFLKYSIRHKTLLISTILLSFVASGLSALPAWLIKYLVDDVLISKNVKMLVIVISGLIISTILKGIASYFTDVKSAFVTETIRREIKIDVFKHLQNLPISYYKNNKLGDIMARLSGDASMLGRIGFLIFDVLKEVTTAIVLLVRIFQVNTFLSIISLTALPAVMNLIKKYTKKLRKAGRQRQDIAGELTAYTQESLSGINIVKAFATEDSTTKNYSTLNMKEFDASMKARKIRAKVSPINEVITVIMVAIVAGYGCYLVSSARVLPT